MKISWGKWKHKAQSIKRNASTRVDYHFQVKCLLAGCKHVNVLSNIKLLRTGDRCFLVPELFVHFECIENTPSEYDHKYGYEYKIVCSLPFTLKREREREKENIRHNLRALGLHHRWLETSINFVLFENSKLKSIASIHFVKLIFTICNDYSLKKKYSVKTPRRPAPRQFQKHWFPFGWLVLVIFTVPSYEQMFNRFSMYFHVI